MEIGELMPRKYKPPLSDLTVKAEDCYNPADYRLVHKRLIALGCSLCGSDKNTFVCAGCSARFEASILQSLIEDLVTEGFETSEGVIAHLTERAADCKRLSEKPQPVDAVDPTAADPGTPTTRA